MECVGNGHCKKQNWHIHFMASLLYIWKDFQQHLEHLVGSEVLETACKEMPISYVPAPRSQVEVYRATTQNTHLCYFYLFIFLKIQCGQLFLHREIFSS